MLQVALKASHASIFRSMVKGMANVSMVPKAIINRMDKRLPRAPIARERIGTPVVPASSTPVTNATTIVIIMGMRTTNIARTWKI